MSNYNVSDTEISYNFIYVLVAILFSSAKGILVVILVSVHGLINY